ncbi:hypothetical protein Pfo_019267 [Paulownia fortunei]|nr:hypothetical protein Pfo_019267 [Paulownia fortunei]
MSAPEPPPPGIPEEVWCKNRLQQYTQRASIPLPVYQTFGEGAPHAPHFRSRVWVDGTCFLSPNTFSNRKMAEQDAAKHALIGIREKVKNEGSSRILEDTIFCKSIINEYALKMNLKPPTYVTNESKAMLPIFVSSLVLNGVTFVGDAGKNKKEAEQFAARSAILSILAIVADSESSTTMSEIVKSKFKFYDILKKVKGSSSVQGSTVPAGVKPSEDFKDSSSVQGGNVPAGMNPLEDSGALFSVNKRKEVHVSGGTVTGPSAAIPQSSLLAPFPAIQQVLPESTTEQLSDTQATHQSLHEFKKLKSQTSSAAIAPPIVFVPPASEQALIRTTSGKKRNRKNKKAKKKVQHQSPLTVVMIPQSPVHACSAAQ